MLSSGGVLVCTANKLQGDMAMKFFMKKLVFGVMLAGAATISMGYSNPIEGGSSETVTNNWDAGFQLAVGEHTASNTLSITNGGTVFDGVGIIGERLGSDGNSVIVSGSGSAWTNISDLVIGNGGSANSLIIEDGSLVYSANGVIGVEEGSANNSVVVRGTNSVWENSDTLMVGRKGDNNSLAISDGATVNSSFGAIGFENPANGNAVEVGGVGSTWNNSGDMLIGSALNSGNSLTIQNGGKVVVGGQLDIYRNNDLYLNDGGWLKIDGHADLDYSDTFHYNAGSTLEVTGSVWFDGRVRDRNTLIFQGENVDWLGFTRSHVLSVGEIFGDNTVIISNKANLAIRDAEIGRFGSSDSNQMIVSGEGTMLTIQTNLYVGNGGSDNLLRVMDGASVSAVTSYVGYASSDNRIDVSGGGTVSLGETYVGYSNAQSNVILVDGSGSSVEAGSVYLGYDSGLSNRIEVVNGGTANLGNTYIGYLNSLHSSILVDGSNSSFSASSLYVGDNSRFSTFTVTSGAQASSGSSFIGSGTNGNDNLAFVTGDGSVWDAGTLTIGSSEGANNNNVLVIENGGKVEAADIEVYNSTNNNAIYLNEGGWLKVAADMDATVDWFNWAARSTLEVQGVITMPGYTNIVGTTTNRHGYHDGENTLILSGGGIWSNDYSVTVGLTNSLNHLKLIDGGTIVDTYGNVGFNADSSFNTVEVGGSGSLWSNRADFVVGVSGSDNSVVIANNGMISANGDTVIGANAGSDRNQIVVNGAGAHLYNRFDSIMVGYDGASNELLVLDGGLATSVGGYVGLNSDGNNVLIDGEGSSWDNRSALRVGMLGSSNEFTVSNGGVASVAGNTYIGDRDGSDGNALAVEGHASRLYNTINIHVGHEGSGNALEILDGARVYNDIGLLGTDNGADNNRAIIDGEGSLWYNRHTFFAGNSGSSNTVTVRNGAMLADTTGYIGYHTNAISNRVVVDNASWENSDGLFVGFNGSGNNLVITNGAQVSSGESRIGAEGFANDNQVLVSGTGSVWNISKSLLVGNSANSNNNLVVESGGKVVVDENISVGSDNTLTVNDGGTVTVFGDTIFTDGFNVASGGTLESFGGVSGIGGVLESGRTLRLVGAGASWNESGDILVESGAMLDIGAGAVVSTPSNYTQQAVATLRFGMATNSAGVPLSGSLQVGRVADFSDGANFLFASDIGDLSFDETYTNTLVSAGTLVVGGQTNATTADLARYLNSDGTLIGISFLAEDQDILAIINRIGLSGGLNPDNEDLKAVLDEIDGRATAGDPLANKQLAIINSMSMQQANDELSQFYTRGIPTYQHMDGVLQGLKQIDKRTSEMLIETGAYEKPVGAYGPAVAEGPWRGWISAYGNQGTRDASNGLSGYDAGTHGTVLGIDKSFNNMIMGLSGGSAGSTIDQDDGDTSDATTVYGALYATAQLKNVDLDLIGSYGTSSVESRSGTIFGSEAEMDASTTVFYIGASKEAISGPITFTPVVAFQVANYSQDGYDEVSENAIGRSVDSYDRWSYQSILGFTLGSVKTMESFDFITRVKASWQHEFNTDIESLNYTLIDGTDPHYFLIQAPVEDALDLGVSIGALFGKSLEFSLGLDGRYSKEFMAVGYNGKIQYSF